MTSGPPRTWRLDLPYSRPPLTMNDRLHRHAAARLTAQLRRDAAMLARYVHIPALPRIAVELHYVPRDARRRDPINLEPTVKAIEDGLVDAGVVPDDVPQYVEPTAAVIDPPVRRIGPGPAPSRLYVLVRQLEPLPVISDAAADAILGLASLDAELRGHRPAPKVWSPW